MTYLFCSNNNTVLKKDKTGRPQTQATYPMNRNRRGAWSGERGCCSRPGSSRGNGAHNFQNIMGTQNIPNERLIICCLKPGSGVSKDEINCGTPTLRRRGLRGSGRPRPAGVRGQCALGIGTTMLRTRSGSVIQHTPSIVRRRGLGLGISVAVT